VKLRGIKKEIIIVDDKSIDESRKIMEKLKEKHSSIKLVFRSHQGGKGAAVRSGFKKTSGDYIIIQDADLEYDPKDIPPIVKTNPGGESPSSLWLKVYWRTPEYVFLAYARE